MPDAQVRLAAQVRHDLLAERPEEAGVAVHRGHADGQPLDEPGQHRGLVQDPVLQGGDRGEPLVAHQVTYPAAQGAAGVFAEVEPVDVGDRLQQQAELDLFRGVGGGPRPGFRVRGHWRGRRHRSSDRATPGAG